VRILITGAAGFIGSHTTDLLLTESHQVCGIDNFRTGRRANLTAAMRQPRFVLKEFDFTDEAALAAAFAEFRPDAVIHLAALVSVPESISNPAENQRLNLDGTRTLAAVCRRFKVRRVVFASSAAVYGPAEITPVLEHAPKSPLSPYGEAKLQSEKLLLDFGDETGAVVRCHRYFNVYGQRQDPSSAYSGVISKFADALRARRKPTIYGDGEQSRDFVYVGDVARANVIAATASAVPSGSANICTGTAVSLNSLFATMAHLAGSSVTQPDYAPAREGDIRQSCGSPVKAQQELGFTAQISLKAGLRMLLA
jgi:UDP-glucose 4-epimerase